MNRSADEDMVSESVFLREAMVQSRASTVSGRAIVLICRRALNENEDSE